MEPATGGNNLTCADVLFCEDVKYDLADAGSVEIMHGVNPSVNAL